MSASGEDLVGVLRACEERLLHGDPLESAGLLAPGFEEVGVDGRRGDRDAVLRWLRERDPSRRWRFLEFVATPLAEDLALVRYLARREGAVEGGSRRVSLWRRSEGVWQLQYHQATRLAAGAASAAPSSRTNQEPGFRFAPD